MYTDAVDKTPIGPLFLNKLIDTAAYSRLYQDGRSESSTEEDEKA